VSSKNLIKIRSPFTVYRSQFTVHRSLNSGLFTKIRSLFTVHCSLNSGITFVSVVILVAVISLSVWSALVLSDIILKSQTVETTEQEMEAIREGLYNFYRDCDQFVKDTNVIATDFADLESQPAAARFEGSSSLQSYRQSRWDGPYIQDSYDDNGYTQDAWKTDYVYNYTAGATSCTLTSYGLNRASGGGDDITITIYADDIVAEKIRKTKEELAYINAKKDELETRYNNAGQTWPPTGFSIDDLFKTYGADTTDLVAWWKMDEASWNGTSGEVVDSQGSNNGTAYGGVTTVSTSKLGRCGSFDGTDDYVDVGNAASITTGLESGFTLEAWIKTSSAQIQRIIDNDYLENSLSFNVKDTQVIQLSVNTGSWESIEGNTDIVDNAWHHVVGLYDGSEIKLYIDGQSDATPISIGTPVFYQNTVHIGVKGQDLPGTYTQPFDGLIDEVRIWSRALTSTDVFQEYLRGPYLTDWAYKYDEWETEYAWDSINDEFYSYGPDKASGGGDDITQD